METTGCRCTTKDVTPVLVTRPSWYDQGELALQRRVREGKEYSRGKVSSSRGKAWDI
jgi:hypothetical protein